MNTKKIFKRMNKVERLNSKIAKYKTDFKSIDAKDLSSGALYEETPFYLMIMETY